MLERQGVVFRIEGRRIVLLAEGLAGLPVRAVLEPVSGVFFFKFECILVVICLKQLVVNKNPIVLRADVRAQQAGNYLTVIDRRPTLPKVMQQGRPPPSPRRIHLGKPESLFEGRAHTNRQLYQC